MISAACGLRPGSHSRTDRGSIDGTATGPSALRDHWRVWTLYDEGNLTEAACGRPAEAARGYERPRAGVVGPPRPQPPSP